MAGWLINFFTNLGTIDPTNSFKLYSTSMVQKLNLKSRTSFSVTLEIVMKAYAIGNRVKEFPTVWTDRSFGESNFPLTRSLFSYFPWLSIIFLKNRFYSFSNRWLIKKYTNSTMQ